MAIDMGVGWCYVTRGIVHGSPDHAWHIVALDVQVQLEALEPELATAEQVYSALSKNANAV